MKGINEKTIYLIRKEHEDLDRTGAEKYFNSIIKEEKKNKKNRFFKNDLGDKIELVILEKSDEIEKATIKGFIEI